MTEEKLRKVLEQLRFRALQQPLVPDDPLVDPLVAAIDAALAEPPRVQTIPRDNLEQFLKREGR